jgi:hypothetical protein
MMTRHDFRMSPQEMNHGSRIVANSLIVTQNPAWKCRQRRRQQLLQKTTMVFTETRLLVLHVVPREQNFNQDHFLVTIAPGLYKENTNAKRRIGRNQLAMHMYSPMCDKGRKIREDFTRKK